MTVTTQGDPSFVFIGENPVNDNELDYVSTYWFIVCKVMVLSSCPPFLSLWNSSIVYELHKNFNTQYSHFSCLNL